MKVGDLVVLSAAGSKIKQTWEFRRGYGLVVKAYPKDTTVCCRWIFPDGRTEKQIFYRYEVKYKSRSKR